MPRIDTNRLDIASTDMRIFVAVGQARTLTQAAASLQVSLATVSRALKRIESTAQLMLVKRGRDTLHLTSAGREYLRACSFVLEAHQAAAEVLTTHREIPEGTLRIAVPNLFGRFVLPTILPEFRKLYPKLKIDIDLYCSDWDQGPKVSHDVFLKIRTPNDSRHHVKLFPAIRQGLFASPRYLAERPEPAHPRELRGHACLGYDHKGAIVPWDFSRKDESLTLDTDFCIAVADPEILARLAINAEGVAILPLWLAHSHMPDGQLVRVLPEWTPDPLVFCALHSGRSRMASKEGAFLKFLEQILGTAKDPRSHGGDPERFFIARRPR